MRAERGVRGCDPGARLQYTIVAEVAPRNAPKKIPTLEPNFTVAANPHVKGEFRYRSGMVELGLGDFLGPSHVFLADFNFQ